MPGLVVIADANILINFIRIRSLHILKQLPETSFGITPEVYEEILPGRGKEQLKQAVREGWLTIHRVEEMDALLLFARYRKTLGRGEAASLALVKVQKWILATDDRQCRSMAGRELGSGKVMGTIDLLREAIRTKIVTMEQGDLLLESLKNEGFEPKIKSFRNL